MEFKEMWPTKIGSGKFDTDGLIEYIFTNYDLNNMEGEVNGGNIFKDNSDEMNKFKDMVYSNFDRYLQGVLAIARRFPKVFEL